MIFYILYQYFQKYNTHSNNLHILKKTIMGGGCIYFVIIYFNILSSFSLYIMNMVTLNILYKYKDTGQHIFIQNTDPLHQKRYNGDTRYTKNIRYDVKKPNVVFKQKNIDLNQTFHHTIENIGIN